MSSLFLDTEIEVVKIVAQKRDGSGSSTYYFALDFWWTSEIYSGSPICYPLLVDSPNSIRSCGVSVAVRHNISITLYAHAPLTSVNDTFADLVNTHNLHGAAVQIRYYVKPTDSTTTHSDDVNIRHVLEIVDENYNQDENTIQLVCRDTWFDDKPFGRRFSDVDILDSSAADKWVGEQAPILFGDSEDADRGVISSSCPLSGDPDYDVAPIVGIGLTDHAITNYVTRNIYVRNPFKDLDPREWLELDFSAATVPYNGPSSWAGGPTAFSMQQWRFAAKITPGTTARLITGATVKCKKVGTITAASGQLMVTVKRAVQAGSTNWTAVGNVLAQASVDAPTVTNTVVATDVEFYFDTPFVAVPGHSYFVICEWTNSTDAANYVEFYYDPAITSNPVYTNDQTVNRDGWAETAAQFQMKVWDHDSDGIAASNNLGDGSYDVFLYILNCNQTTAPSFVDYSTTEFKIGAKFTSNADYTGSAGGTLENPAAIIKFLLQDDTFCLGLVADTDFDDDEIEAVRSTLGTGLNLGFSIEYEATCGELIQRVCEQARLRLYKKRIGLLTLNFPQTPGATFAADLTEARYQGDLQCMAIAESPEGELINKVDALHSINVLNLQNDAALTRRTRDNRYADVEYISATDSSNSDTVREAASDASADLFGVRYSSIRLDFHNRSSTALKVLNYLFDRYSMERRRLTIRVLRKTWYNTLDLFSAVRVRHSLIPNVFGTRVENPGKAHDGSGTGVTSYFEGTPISAMGSGELVGEVVELSEQGPYMVATIETVNSHEGYV